MLDLFEAGTRKQMNAPKKKYNTRFLQGLEWKILDADAVAWGCFEVREGNCSEICNPPERIASESYMGYL